MTELAWLEEFVQCIERGTLRGKVEWIRTLHGWCGQVRHDVHRMIRVWCDDGLDACRITGDCVAPKDGIRVSPGPFAARLRACVYDCQDVWKEIIAALQKAGC